MTAWESADKLIKKEIIKQGDFNNTPTEQSICTIFVKNPRMFELSIKEIKENLHSEIVDAGARKVIVIGEACSLIDRSLERAIQTMSLKEQSLITVQIPIDEHNTDILSVEITLEKIELHEPIWNWTPEEKYNIALKHKEKGVELFKAKRHIDAFNKFSKACKILITLEPIEVEEDPVLKNVCNLKYILYNNMAECQLVRENYEHAITLCNKVLSKEENNVKALYRRGVAYGNLRDFEKAANDLKTVVNLEPKNKKAHEKFNIYSEKWRMSVQGYENMIRKMFKA